MAHGRGVARLTNPVGGHLLWYGLKSERIKRMVINHFSGMGLTRDSLVSVMYPAGLNSAKSSVTLQRTDRHGILGEKPSDLQVSL